MFKISLPLNKEYIKCEWKNDFFEMNIFIYLEIDVLIENIPITSY